MRRTLAKAAPLMVGAMFYGLGDAMADDSLIEQGLRQLDDGQVVAARSLFEQAIVESTDSARAYAGLGSTLLRLQDYPGAVSAFEQAVLLDGTRADPYIGMAAAHLRAGAYADARAALEQAELIEPARSADAEGMISLIDQMSGAQ